MIHKLGDRGDEIGRMQQRLTRAGYPVEVTHIFDAETEKAVMALQRASGLVVDGICGPKTFIAMMGSDQPKHLKDADLVAAADKLGVPLACVRAVNEVESRGQGFLMPDGRPAILFERHVFWKRLQKHGVDPATLSASPSILSQTPGGYQGGAAEYVRLESAKHINMLAAYESASWGAFQVMAYHWEALGYDSVLDFIARMQRDEAEHLDAFVRYILADSDLHAALKGRKWAKFAELYNGPAYKRNLYDAKLAQAYAKYAGAEKAVEAAEKVAA
jgi:hypothetical protein